MLLITKIAIHSLILGLQYSLVPYDSDLTSYNISSPVMLLTLEFKFILDIAFDMRYFGLKKGASCVECET